MPFTPYEASAPVFANTLSDMRAWLDKAAEHEAALIGAKLADDMRPLPAQYQMASDTAKNTVARLAGIEAPKMEDNEATFDELRARMDKTIAFVRSVDPAVAGEQQRPRGRTEISERDGLSFPRRRVFDQLCATQLLLPRDDRLRDPARERRAAGQAGFPAASGPAQPAGVRTRGPEPPRFDYR